MANINLPKLPSLRNARSTNGGGRPCQCGCGLTCNNMFRPGHDARLKSGVVALVRGMPIEEISAAMGAAFGRAVEKTLDDANRLKTWDLTEAVAEYRASLVPEVEEVEQAG